jgi:hypothetical protein
MKKCIALILALQLLLIPSVSAQETSSSGAGEDFMKTTQTDIILVGAAGLGGAVLGLSTLSFYDTPSKHISNIWTGAAIGVIMGVIVVAYISATKNSDHLTAQSDFGTRDRSLWHAQNDKLLSFQSVQFGTQIWQTSF